MAFAYCKSCGWIGNDVAWHRIVCGGPFGYDEIEGPACGPQAGCIQRQAKKGKRALRKLDGFNTVGQRPARKADRPTRKAGE